MSSVQYSGLPSSGEAKIANAGRVETAQSRIASAARVRPTSLFGRSHSICRNEPHGTTAAAGVREAFAKVMREGLASVRSIIFARANPHPDVIPAKLAKPLEQRLNRAIHRVERK
jgi:hypothetical protein